MAPRKRNFKGSHLSATSKAGIIKRTNNGTRIATSERRSIKRIEVRFFATYKGYEPVRSWLKGLPAADKKTIGEDIMTVEVGWPLGMPTCRQLQGNLWEIRSTLEGNRIARVLFFTDNSLLVLVNGFIKKTQATPHSEIKLALKRIKEYRS